MEQDILKVLNFQLATPTVYTFLQRYLRVCVTEIGKQDAITYQVLAALSQVKETYLVICGMSQ